MPGHRGPKGTLCPEATFSLAAFYWLLSFPVYFLTSFPYTVLGYPSKSTTCCTLPFGGNLIKTLMVKWKKM